MIQITLSQFFVDVYRPRHLDITEQSAGNIARDLRKFEQWAGDPILLKDLTEEMVLSAGKMQRKPLTKKAKAQETAPSLKDQMIAYIRENGPASAHVISVALRCDKADVDAVAAADKQAFRSVTVPGGSVGVALGPGVRG